MTPAQLDALCAQAMERIKQAINRSAAQHMRRMRESWRAGT